MLVRPEPSQEAAPIWFVTKETWPKIRASLPGLAQAFASACGFEPTPGRAQILPGPEGEIAGVLLGSRAPSYGRAICCFRGKWQHRCLPASTASPPPRMMRRWPRCHGFCPAIVSTATRPITAMPHGFAFPMASMPSAWSGSRAASFLGAISSTPPPMTWTRRRSKPPP